MNFGRDARTIHKHLKSRGMALSPDLGDPIKYIDSLMLYLWESENVIDYIPCPPNFITTLFLITDSGKLLFSEVATTVTPGAIFDKTEIVYSPSNYMLATLNEQESFVETYKERRLFGETWDIVRLFFDGGSFDLKLKKGDGQAVYKAFIAAKKKHMPKTTKPKATTKTKEKSKAPDTQGVGSGEIESIRKMYEDGLITKEEMMELIKAHLAK